MPTLRSTLAGLAALTLAVGSGSTAMALGDVDEIVMPVGVDIEDAFTTWQTWTASDPRLSGETAYREQRRDSAEGGFHLCAHEWTVVNAEGSWTGARYSVFSEGTGSGAVLLVLHGQGAYEGLTAYLDWGVDGEGHPIRGVIVADDASDTPPFPAPAG